MGEGVKQLPENVEARRCCVIKLRFGDKTLFAKRRMQDARWYAYAREIFFFLTAVSKAGTPLQYAGEPLRASMVCSMVLVDRIDLSSRGIMDMNLQ